MPGLLTDTAVLISVIATVAAIVAAGARSGWRPAAWPVWAVPTLLASLATGVGVDHYLRIPPRGLHPWTLFLLAGAVAAVAVAARLLEPSAGPVPGRAATGTPSIDDPDTDVAPAGAIPAGPERRRLDPLGVTGAAAALGAFLCVPETMLLRALVAPVALAAAASSAGLIRPFTRPGATGLAVLVAWVALIDGQSRPASVVGATAGLAGVALRASFRPGAPLDGFLPAVATVLAAGAAATAARLGGVQTSALPAVSTAATILGPVLVGLLVMSRLQARLDDQEGTTRDS